MKTYTVFVACNRRDRLDKVARGTIVAPSPKAAIRDSWGADPGERFVVIDHEAEVAHVFKADAEGKLKRVLSTS